ncbi:DNA helicase INO80-like, partial [Limulus polyphemus]|uniref:Chromatin-remodeling ATPase INO80 n=1 Tax=Limulus polyphemus TaxID=6850 RepID=A0ABM1TKX9_LIMPO
NNVTHTDCAFSFTRFIDISPAELSSVALTGLLARTLQHNGLLLVQTLPTVKPCALPPLVFTDPCSSVYTLTTHLLHCMPETTQHRQIRLQKLIAKHNQSLSVPGSPSLSPPSLKVVSEPLRVYCCDPSAIWWQKYNERCGDPRAFRWIMYGDPDATLVSVHQAANQFNPLPPGGLCVIQPMDGWSRILIPDKETLVTDSGKLDVLDDLLMRLKAEGHRVLIYSQMTRMIDLLEEYMWHRKHTYMRLDGSSKISDRRDMVAGFQTRSDIFVFLLSTRAGGLGINLTAADTIQRMVISGGNFKPDTLKPKEVVSLLLDDEELEKKFRQRQEERRKEQEEANVDSGQRRKYKGAKRGPKPKRKKLEENITTPAPSDPATPTHQDGDSVLSVDSVPPSPYSELSVNSLAMAHDDTSSEGPLVVDDGSPSVPPPTKVTSISA